MEINLSKLKSILFFSSLFLSVTVCAESQEAMREFLKKINAIDAMSGEFKQVISDLDGEEIQATDGNFKVKRPGMFYWEVAPPYEQLVIGNIDALAVYDADLGQATLYSNHALENTPALILSGSPEAIAADYIVAKSKSNSYELLPRDAEQSAFDSLNFRFKGKKLKSLRFIDKLGQTTDVSFSKVKLNPEIDEAVFVFVPPPGTDVIINE